MTTVPFMHQSDRIYVAGHRGLVGSAIVRRLQREGYTNLVTRTHAELDLTDSNAVQSFMQEAKPAFVFLAAAKVGGILANSTCPADFIRENLSIQNSVIDAAYRNRVGRLLFLGSSCIYPRDAEQPIRESSLLTGPLEATNRSYAVAKIAGVEMCRGYNQQYGTKFLAAMPTNLYGPGDNFDLNTSHVLPAIIRKTAHALRTGAPEVVLWGTGTPRRELLYSDDMAEACVFLMNLAGARYNTLLGTGEPPLINIGTGEDVAIRELAETVFRILGYRGSLAFDPDKPDGTPRKVMDVGRIHALGWRHSTSLEQGIQETWDTVKDSLG